MTLPSELPEPLETFAKYLAKKDRERGGHEFGGWGAALIVWAAQVGRDHQACGEFDLSALDDYKAGKTRKLTITCPVHGQLEGPEMPT